MHIIHTSGDSYIKTCLKTNTAVCKLCAQKGVPDRQRRKVRNFSIANYVPFCVRNETVGVPVTVNSFYLA